MSVLGHGIGLGIGGMSRLFFRPFFRLAEWRLRGSSTKESAIAYAPHSIADLNGQFGNVPTLIDALGTTSGLSIFTNLERTHLAYDKHSRNRSRYCNFISRRPRDVPALGKHTFVFVNSPANVAPVVWLSRFLQEKEMTNAVAESGSAVHSIGHFALNVPSIDDARRFYQAFGLDVRDVGDGPEAHLELRALDGYRWARILPAPSKSLAYLSFSCFENDLDALSRQVRDAGGSFCADDAAFATDHVTGTGFWFYDPDGNLIHVGVGQKTSPDQKLEFRPHEKSGDTRGVLPLSQTATVRPRRMSHVGLFTPNVERAVDFYQRALGLRLSDRAVPFAAFMHGVHGSDHHIVSLAKSSAKGWHHAAWDVDGVNEVGTGSAQMAAAGYTRGWGTGRHVLGSNYFHYVLEP